MEFPGGLSLFSDGSFVRSQPPQPVPSDPSFVNGVASKDIVLFPEKDVWIRLFLPETAQSGGGAKLPIVFYMHSGGFVLFSAGDSMFDAFCRRLANEGRAIVVTVEYRLAPEHRLPVAFDDCFEALQWLHSSASSSEEPWLRLYADYSSFFLMGHSAGGAIAHQLAIRVAERSIAPLELAGLILAEPFFGGDARVRSEIELGGEGAFLTLKMTDLLWFFSLPEGASRDHPYSNVLSSQAPQLAKDKAPPVLVIVGELDLLHDRQIEYVKALKNAGITVFLDVIKGGDHAMMLKDKANQELECVLRFLNGQKQI